MGVIYSCLLGHYTLSSPLNLTGRDFPELSQPAGEGRGNMVAWPLIRTLSLETQIYQGLLKAFAHRAQRRQRDFFILPENYVLYRSLFLRQKKRQNNSIKLDKQTLSTLEDCHKTRQQQKIPLSENMKSEGQYFKTNVSHSVPALLFAVKHSDSLPSTNPCCGSCFSFLRTIGVAAPLG